MRDHAAIRPEDRWAREAAELAAAWHAGHPARAAAHRLEPDERARRMRSLAQTLILALVCWVALVLFSCVPLRVEKAGSPVEETRRTEQSDGTLEDETTPDPGEPEDGEPEGESMPASAGAAPGPGRTTQPAH
jgi:hypothetical protein